MVHIHAGRYLVCHQFVLMIFFTQTRYGGHGYAHILENIVSKMQERGISKDVTMQILTQNPQEWLNSFCMKTDSTQSVIDNNNCVLTLLVSILHTVKSMQIN